MVASAREPMVVADAWRDEYPIVYHNGAFKTLFGGEVESHVGTPLMRCFQGGAETGLGKALRLEQRFSGTVALSVADEPRAEASLFPLRDTRNRVRYFLATLWVAPAAQESRQDPEAEVERDLAAASSKSLEHFVDTIGRDMAVAHREKRSIGIIVFRIDELDQYEETFGVQAVDACVRMVGGRIFGCLRRAGDLSTQYSDDSFVAAVLDQDQETAAAFAKSVGDEVRELGLHSPRTKARYVTVSAATRARVPNLSESPEEWINELFSSLDLPD